MKFIPLYLVIGLLFAAWAETRKSPLREAFLEPTNDTNEIGYTLGWPLVVVFAMSNILGGLMYVAIWAMRKGMR